MSNDSSTKNSEKLSIICIKMGQSIQKFGLKHCDFPTMLSNSSDMLRLLTLNVDGRNKKPIPLILYITMVISSFCYFYCYVISGIWFSFIRCFQTGDLAAATIVFSLIIISKIGIVKLFYMIIYRDHFIQLTNSYLYIDSCVTPNSRFSKTLTKTLKKVKLRAITYWLVLVLNGVVYVMKPLFLPGRHLPLDIYIIYGLEPMFESPNFEIASVVTAISVLLVCYTVANVTGLLILIIGYNEAQILALSIEIRNIWNDAKLYYKKNSEKVFFSTPYNSKICKDVTINKYIREHLIDVIKNHATNKQLLREIEDMMRGPNVIGFMLLIIGLIAEMLGGLQNTYLQLPFTLTQLGADCYLGQKVIDSNIAFERAVYGCKWERFDESNKKLVLVILQNAQNSVTLSAGGMATLSFACFMSIMRSAYSAYTAFRSRV